VWFCELFFADDQSGGDFPQSTPLFCLCQVKELLGDKPLVPDREFSYLELLEDLVAERVNFVIRFKLGPKFWDGEGKPV
jgi:hypothetical protein